MQKKEFVKLGDSSHDFLQVLLPEFIITRNNKGIKVEIDLKDEFDTLRNSRDKITVNNKYNKSNKKESLTKELDLFYQNDQILSYHVRCEQFPLRYANGGVLPIIHIDNINYFCFFYRDIFPVGWNIANGASNNVDDLLYPEKIIHREFLEELFFFDHKKKIHYCIDNDPNSFLAGTFKEALELWKNKMEISNNDDYKTQPLPVKWINGPDTILINKIGKKFSADNIFVNITPDDNAIEIDRIAIIKLDKNVTILDGEVEKQTLLNQIIGLFSVDKLLDSLDSNEFIPDFLFYNGEKYQPDKLEQLINNDYIPNLERSKIRNKKDRGKYEVTFDLCPITRTFMTKYKKWDDKLKYESESKSIILTKPIEKTVKFDVFISYKSEDNDLAFWLFDFLESKNISVFCSGKSIPMMGESEYAKVIDIALEESQSLIVLGTKPEYFDSGWVSYEWRSFMNEIHSQRKTNGRIFTLTQDIPISSLPYALRFVQNIPFSKNILRESFSNILLYISK
jgi:hypothetical protein